MTDKVITPDIMEQEQQSVWLCVCVCLFERGLVLRKHAEECARAGVCVLSVNVRVLATETPGLSASHSQIQHFGSNELLLYGNCASQSG